MGAIKIFGIGLSKTGSTSLHEALARLGYRSLHFTFQGKPLKYIFEEHRKLGKKLLEGLEEYDAFLDFGGKDFFPEMDRQYPGSKFIFTQRDQDSWMRSMTAHVLMNRWDPFCSNRTREINKKKYKDWYQSYSDDVFRYFRGRESQFLVLKVCDGEGWEKVCPFLDKTIPAGAFPRMNTKNGRFYATLKHNIKNVIKMLFCR